MNQQPQQAYPPFQMIGTEFVQQYYKLFDDPATRQNLQSMYHVNAFMTFEDEEKMGRANIMEKLKILPFGKLARALTNVDSQPTLDGGVLVVVSGQVKADDESRPLGYFHVFKLSPEDGSFYITNEFFRLGLHNF